MSSQDLKNYLQYRAETMDLSENYDGRTCKLAKGIKAKGVDTVKFLQKIESLSKRCQRRSYRTGGSADKANFSKTASCPRLRCCIAGFEKDGQNTADTKSCGFISANSTENTGISRKISSSSTLQQRDRNLNTSDRSLPIPNSSTVKSCCANDGSFAFFPTTSRHRKLRSCRASAMTVLRFFTMLTTFLLMLHLPKSAGSPIIPHLTDHDIQAKTTAGNTPNEFQKPHQGTSDAATSNNPSSGERQLESTSVTYVWPDWLQNPPKETPVVRSRRQERATKRGLPPKYLMRHEFLQRLYSRNYYFLEILRNGKVRGTRNQNSSYSVLRIKSVAVGVLVIFGTKSKKYLAMNKKGKLYGSKTLTDECKFYEKMANNRYFTYQIVPSWKKKKKPMFVGFDKKGKAKRGNRIRSTNNGALFAKLDAPAPKKRSRKGKKKNKP